MISEAEGWTEHINCYDHDFHHTWDFHQISANNGEGQPILFHLVHEGDSISYPLLQRKITGDQGYKDLMSVYGYPGPLFSTEDKVIQNQLLAKLFEELTELNYISLFSRLHPIINGATLTCSQYVGDVVYFDLTKDISEIYANMRRCHKQDIKKIKKSELKLIKHKQINCNNIIQFKKIYDATMDVLKASEYYYFSVDYYRSFFDSDQFNSSLYTIYAKDTAIASAITTHTGGFAQYHLSGTLPEYYNMKAMKLILYTAMEDLHSLGLKYFILGGGVGAEKDTLFNFKYGFGRNTAPFHIIKKVFNQEIYDQLVDQHFKALNLSQEEEISYFPLYDYVK